MKLILKVANQHFKMTVLLEYIELFTVYENHAMNLLILCLMLYQA